MKEIFDNYLEQSFGEKKQAEFKIIHFNQNYRHYFPTGKDANLLDIGIGRGEMLECLKRWGYNNSLGIDISPSIIEFCKSLDYNCRLVPDTTAWLKEHRNSFDMITLLDVIEHIPKGNIIELLSALHGSLSRQGALIIQTPNLQAPDGHLFRYDDFTHEVGFTEHSLRQVLLAAGFTDISFHGFEGYILNSWKQYIGKALRNIFWKYVTFKRIINNNLTPSILNPVFYAVVRK